MILLVILIFAGCGGDGGGDDDNENASDDDGSGQDDDGWSDDDVSDDGWGDDDAAGDDGWDDDGWDDDGMDDDAGDDDTSGGDDDAGQLTAGEWRDLDHWDFWLNLLVDEQDEPGPYAYMEDYWGFYTRDRFAVVVTDEGVPVVDAAATLSKNGDIIWQTRTDNLGRAELFANIYGGVAGTYKISVSNANDTATIDNVVPKWDPPIAVELDAVAPSDNVDLMFTIDTTGSMGDELSYLQDELADVITRVYQETSGINLRLSVNFYRDEGDDYVVRPFPFTTDIDEALAHLAAQSSDGGGDYEEAVHTALADAVFDHSWSTAARARLLFHVHDAPPHYQQDIIESLHQTIETAAKKGIRYMPVIASGADQHTEFLVRFMDIATGGTFIFLTDDSGIGGDHIEPTIGDYEVEFLNDLLVRVIGEAVAVP